MEFETLVPQNIGGGGGLTYVEVANYAALPSAAAHTGEDYLVQTSTGLWPFNAKPAGLWRSNGTTWIWLGDSANEATEIAVTPVGGISSTDVQAALAELDTEKANAASLGTASTHPTGDFLQTANNLSDVTPATARGNLGLGTSATHPVSDLQPHPGFVPGRWYNPLPGSVAAATSAAGANAIKLLPFYLEQPITISALAVRITTLAAAGNCQAAIYAHDPATGTPTGAALCSTGNISTAAAGAVSANLGSNATLQPGLYWMATNQDNGTVIFQLFAASLIGLIGHFVGSTTLATLTSGAATGMIGYSIAQAFGTWPNLTGAAFAESAVVSGAIVYMKAA